MGGEAWYGSNGLHDWIYLDEDRYLGQPDTFVELKTSMSIRNNWDEAKFEKSVLLFLLIASDDDSGNFSNISFNPSCLEYQK